MADKPTCVDRQLLGRVVAMVVTSFVLLLANTVTQITGLGEATFTKGWPLTYWYWSPRCKFKDGWWRPDLWWLDVAIAMGILVGVWVVSGVVVAGLRRLRDRGART